MQAVKELLEAKSVDYGFRVYRLPMPADVPATILSTGTSLLSGSVDVVVPLHAAQAPGALLTPWTCARRGLAARSCCVAWQCIRSSGGPVLLAGSWRLT